MPVTRPEDIEKLSLNHFSNAGKIALCLARANPCAMISHRFWKEFGAICHEKVTKKWYKKHETFLREQGFKIQLLQGNVYVNNRFCDCGGANCNDVTLFSDGLLIKDNTSPLIETVNKVFVEKARDEVSFEDLAGCIAFAPTVERDGVEATYYLTQQPEVVFGDADLCCGPLSSLWDASMREMQLCLETISGNVMSL